MKTCKQICAMAYGSPAQMVAADTWYKRFISFDSSHEGFVSHLTWLQIHNTDVMYQARRRYMDSLQ